MRETIHRLVSCKIQNCNKFSALGDRTPERVYERADASQLFMGLKSFSEGCLTLKDINVAKNYFVAD